MRILTHKLKYFLFFYSAIAYAQFDDVSAIAGDLVYLADKYVSPAADASVYQFSGGWYTSAKKKDLWDLEVSLQGNFLFIPNNSKSFLIDQANLQNLSIKGTETTALTPTALGGKNIVVLEGILGDDTFEFDSPQGIDESYIKHAQIQASLGLWKGTTLVSRFSPKIQINKTYYQVLGFGLQHNLSQWIPSLNDSSFSLAGLVTYSFYTVGDKFTPVSLPIGELSSVIVDGQSFMFNVVASKQIDRFNFSSAVGITSSKFDYKVGGKGSLVINTLNQALGTLNESISNFKADLGIDYRIDDFSINTMLTFGKYTNLIFGLNYNL
ncbi:MAG: hypothetical protein HKO81_02110 [Flavobacteriaceae bacterium]|nr:hypothetical protein [Bacteroidia bacterium]NNL15420.1 hypothetical protein [Flavobacteriaceae bacterium]